MPRIDITRYHKPVGFLELESLEPALTQPTVMLPGLEGDQNGFAVVIEVNNRPMAALIYPFDGETIEISHPFRWSSEPFISPKQKQPQLEQTRLSEAPSLLDVAGYIGVSRDGEEFDVRFETDPRKPKVSIGGGSFRLEIHDEEQEGYLRCNFHGWRRFEKGFFRGHLRSSAREGVRATEVDFKFDGYFPRVHGRGNAWFRSSAERGSALSDVQFDFNSFGWGIGEGDCRFRGDASDFPFLALIQQTITRLETSDRSLPFRLWVGALRYSDEPAEARMARFQLAEIFAQSRLSVSDVGQVARYLATAIPIQGGEEYGQALAPLVEIASPPPRLRRLQQQDIDIEFDDSVSPEKALAFLLAFADELQQAGSRLCLRGQKEDE